jgi:MFS family permease
VTDPRPLANREFRAIVGAQFTSECGDQIGAIALSYLVYARSNSPFFAAATYAVTYLPWVLGSVLLAPLVDRLPRRRVMLGCDLGRAGTTALLVLLTMVHGMPIAVLIATVFVSSCFSPPFAAARGAILPDLFEAGPGYVGAVAIGRIVQQVDQVFGFALGGAIVAAVSPRGALAIDCGTFLLSFAFTAIAVRERAPGVVGGRPSVRSLIAEFRPSLALVLQSRTRRVLLLLSSAALLFLVAPEGLAVAYAREHGHGAVAAGLLTASQPFGIALGAALFIKFVPARKQGDWLLPLAAGGALALTFTALVPPIWLACVLWMVAGLLQCFLVATIAAYNIATDRALRGRANGIAAAAISISQGLGFLVWGAVGTWRGAAAGVAWAGVAGLLIMALIRYGWPDEEIEQAWVKLEAAQHPA